MFLRNLFYCKKTISNGLTQTIKNDLLDKFNDDVPNQPSQKELHENKYLSRYVLAFDRKGYSPDFFSDLWKGRVSIAPYRKNTTDKWDESEFTQHTGTLPFGTQKTIALAETGVFLQKKGSEKIYGQERYVAYLNRGLKHQLQPQITPFRI